MRRAPLVLLVVLLSAVVIAAPRAGAAPARSSDEPAVTTTTAPAAPNIIPRPNEGVEPQDAGDRGGALQTLLFFLIVGATVGIGAMVVRQSRRARAERGF